MRRKIALFGIIIIFCLAGIARSRAAESVDDVDLTYRAELIVKMKSVIDIKHLEKAQSFIEKEKTKVREVLDSHESAPATDHAKYNARDNEVLRLSLAFDPLFTEVTTSEFAKDAKVREAKCMKIPSDIRFGELAAKPEGSKLSEYGELAIATLEKICKVKGNP